ncbi:MAG: hypothetical protein GF311_21505 [Candidatus Lokiarchaeota archaeon]|nr:hypothetical protein [Candidatus Lokiarchaeota archaeon]
MDSKIFITILGDSRFYKYTNYTFDIKSSKKFTVNHWYASFALLKYLNERSKASIRKIFVLYPATEVGMRSFEKGWKKDENKNYNENKAPVKEIISNVAPKSSDVIGISFPNVNSTEEIWDFLTSCLKFLNKVKDSNIFVDITHGFRIYQNLLFSFLYYFENISTNKLEKVYYALFQGEGEETPFIELDQLIMLQQEISQIKLLIQNLDVGAFEALKSRVRALKSYILTLQKVLLLINNGIVSDKLLPKLDYLMDTDKFDFIPNNVFSNYDLFLKKSFVKGIRPEILAIKDAIFGNVKNESKIWQRQLNLAHLLLSRKKEISTSLQLIRESFISWICEDVYDYDSLDTTKRAEASMIFKKLRIIQKENKFGINKSLIFQIIDRLAQVRNSFAHVFSTSDQILLIEKKSQNIVNYIEEILKDIIRLKKLINSKDEKEYLINIINEMEANEYKT